MVLDVLQREVYIIFVKDFCMKKIHYLLFSNKGGELIKSLQRKYQLSLSHTRFRDNNGRGQICGI